MRDRQAQGLRFRAGQCDDLRQLLGGELSGRTAAVVIREQLQDHRLQLRLLDLGRGGRGEPVAGLRPAVSPPGHPLRVDSQGFGLLDGSLACGAPQHDQDSLGEAALYRPGASELLENRTLARMEHDLRCQFAHGPTVILVICESKFLELPPS